MKKRESESIWLLSQIAITFWSLSGESEVPLNKPTDGGKQKNLSYSEGERSVIHLKAKFSSSIMYSESLLPHLPILWLGLQKRAGGEHKKGQNGWLEKQISVLKAYT
jgi:hypothetical protein